VYQKIVGNIPETVKGVCIVDGDRLFAQIPTGHDESCKMVFHQQIMQRGIRQHDPHCLIFWRNTLGQAIIILFLQQHDGSLPGLQQGFVFLAN